MKCVLTIDLGDTVVTEKDVRVLLADLADKPLADRFGYESLAGASGQLRDDDGKVVGSWKVTP